MTTTTTRDRILLNKLKAALEEATGNWTGADWTHELHHRGAIVRDDDGDAYYCNGDRPNCSYCATCKDAAAAAEDEAAQAIEYAAAGLWMDALDSARTVFSLEEEYGDAPTWRPFLHAVEWAVEIATGDAP